jgi:hypothetical protein
MRNPIAPVVSALLVLIPGTAPAQQPPDTSVTLQGFMQENGAASDWAIVTPAPVAALGARTFVVSLGHAGDRWSRFGSRYVEATGHLTRSGTGDLVLDVQRMKEIEPPGTSHAIFDRGMTQHARISLSVVPNRIAWNDSAGHDTGVNPFILYSILNERSAPIYIALVTNDLICLTVQGPTSTWDTTTTAPVPNYHRFVIQHGGQFRQALQVPSAAAPRPGRYVARIGICQFDDYNISTEFEVL